MAKNIKFEKRFIQVADGLLRVVVKEDGIILGMGKVMNTTQVKEWIKNQEEEIEETKDNIRVAEAAIELFTREFITN